MVAMNFRYDQQGYLWASHNFQRRVDEQTKLGLGEEHDHALDGVVRVTSLFPFGKAKIRFPRPSPLVVAILEGGKCETSFCYIPYLNHCRSKVCRAQRPATLWIPWGRPSQFIHHYDHDCGPTVGFTSLTTHQMCPPHAI